MSLVTFVVTEIATGNIIRSGTAPDVTTANANLWNPAEEEIVITSDYVDPTEDYIDPGTGTVISMDPSPITMSNPGGWLADGVDELVFNNIPIHAVDPYYNTFRVLKIQGNGTDTSTTIKDSSKYNWTINNSGALQIETTGPKFGTGYVYNISGGGAYITYSSTLNPGSNDFSIDLWWRFTSSPTTAYRPIIAFRETAVYCPVVIGVNNKRVGASFSIQGSSVWSPTLTGITDINDTNWHHIVVTRTQFFVSLHLDGVQEAIEPISGSLHTSSQNIYLCRDTSSYDSLGVGIDDFRYTIGYADYADEGCTVPVRTLSVGGSDMFWANVVLLLLFVGTTGSTTMTDSSSYNDTTYLVNSSAQIKNDQYRYNAGALWLDGSLDYISYADNNRFNLGSGDFTIETWIRKIYDGVDAGLAEHVGSGNSTSSFTWYIDSNQKLRGGVFSGSTYYALPAGTTTLSDNVWYHVALIRDGVNLKINLNGKTESILNIGTISINNATGRFYIGSSGIYTFHGYMDEFRMTVGTARYKGVYTLPTNELGPDPINPPTVTIIPKDNTCASGIGPLDITDSPLRLTTDTPGDYNIIISSYDINNNPYLNYDVTVTAVGP